MSAIADIGRGQETAAASDDGPALEDGARHVAIADWNQRIADEQQSSRLFAGLLPQMMRVGVDPGFTAAAAEAVVDELRHARLCAAVVESLGGRARAAASFEELPRHGDVAPLEGLLRNVLTISCLEETVGGALLENDHRLARESTLRRVIAEILDDEIRHARLGWQMLQNLAPRIDERMRARLGTYLVPAFTRLFDRYLTAGEAPGTRAVAAKVLLVEVVNEVIVPRLEACDLPARDAVAAALAAPAVEDYVWAATD
jgi:hypothetical protein